MTKQNLPDPNTLLVTHEAKKKKRFNFLFLINIFTTIFMLLPIILIILVSFTPEATYTIPTTEWSLRWYRELAKYPRFFDSFKTSLFLGIIAAAGSVILGFLAAFALSRYDFRGKSAIDSLFLSPLTLPGVTYGFAILVYSTNIGLYNSLASLILVHIILTVPYVVKTLGTSLAGVGKDMELAAMNLGASWFSAFRMVTIPLIKTGMIGAFLFAFLVSFGEVTVAIFIIGANHSTLPLALFNFMADRNTPMVAALSTLLIVFAVVLALVIDRVVGLKNMISSQTEVD